MGWKSFTFLYQRDDALVRLQEVLKDHGPNDPPVTVRQLPYGDDFRFKINNFMLYFYKTVLNRPLLKQVQASSESHIILDCDKEKIIQILRQAKEVKMMEDYQSYFIVTLVKYKKLEY